LHVDDEGEDDDPAKLVAPHVEAMAARFDQANAHNLEELEVLQAEHKALQDQIEELGKSGPRLASLSEQIKILEEDSVKFEKYNDNLEAKVERYGNRVKLLEEEIAKTEAELEEAENEKASLQEVVDSRGITISDIDRMNTERERLQKGVESTSTRLDESRKKVAEKELEALRKLDELERTVEKYNSLGYQIGIIPATAANAKGQDYELIITINDGPNFSGSQMGASQSPGSSDRLLADSGNGYQPHNLLNLDLRGTVKTNILSLRKEIGERRNAALEADMNNHDLLDKIKEAMDDKQSEVEGLGHKVRAAEEEFEKTREITNAQKMASDAQIEKMEKELAKMRAGLSDSVQVMEQREMSTNIE
jgi:kinetochore protein NDC80